MSEGQAAVKLLLVDDVPENLVALEALVRGAGREVFCARSGEEALSLMLDHEFGLAILDVQMPGMSGFEVAETMRSTERTRRIPIILVSAAGRELNYAFRGYETGAVDFLHKPLDPHTVRSKVTVFVELCRQRVALQEAHAQLERAVRMRDDFMSMVSHELRTPLNTLYLQAQLRRKALEAGRFDAAALRKIVERDERQIRSMIRLIDDMLDVSRLRTGRLAVVPAPCDLAALVARVVDAFGEQASASGAPLTLQAPPQLPVQCDEFRIEQVLSNLLTNAFRYGGGKPVQVRLAQDGDRAVLAVTDHGMGIAQEHHARIFEQFERAEGAKQAPGLGLGLFIARQIVRAHGGRIELRSAPGEGSTFTIVLPLMAATEPAEP
ncbi:hybrid sensor histidine kinase/response regulator [Ramlibacter sp. RBP-2]|uniref:histidine kinase n=1 Tax=Ramlibacter lithotrophicus TaxID=2606681 RepID=A0A7X6DE67_9BURK|nr:hybrid sensor histidine kinase/response regulator [Ramlibacter lithotrophicus]NKE65467.1 hybrid sensor histidine kinase/response regulator [Ramlibacter lithotrophicus]